MHHELLRNFFIFYPYSLNLGLFQLICTISFSLSRHFSWFSFQTPIFSRLMKLFLKIEQKVYNIFQRRLLQSLSVNLTIFIKKFICPGLSFIRSQAQANSVHRLKQSNPFTIKCQSWKVYLTLSQAFFQQEMAQWKLEWLQKDSPRACSILNNRLLRTLLLIMQIANFLLSFILFSFMFLSQAQFFNFWSWNLSARGIRVRRLNSDEFKFEERSHILLQITLSAAMAQSSLGLLIVARESSLQFKLSINFQALVESEGISVLASLRISERNLLLQSLLFCWTRNQPKTEEKKREEMKTLRQFSILPIQAQLRRDFLSWNQANSLIICQSYGLARTLLNSNSIASEAFAFLAIYLLIIFIMENFAEGVQPEVVASILSLNERQTVRVVSNRITVLDNSNRMLEEFDFSNIYRSAKSSHIYAETIEKYNDVLSLGRNLMVVSVGSKFSNHKSLMDGAGADSGIVEESLNSLDLHFRNIVDDLDRGGVTNYNLYLRHCMFQIIDQQIFDTYTSAKSSGKFIAVSNDNWTGVRIEGLTYHQDKSFKVVLDKYMSALRLVDQSADGKGLRSSKAATLFILEIYQSYIRPDGNQQGKVSTLTFVSLPAIDHLAKDQQSMRLNNERAGLCLVRFSSILEDLYANREANNIYQSCKLTHILRDQLGGNAYACYIFTIVSHQIQNNDALLKLAKLCSSVPQYPAQNTKNSLGYFHKLRVQSSGNTVESGVKFEEEKRTIEDNLRRIRSQDDYRRILQKYNQIRQKLSEASKKKNQLEMEFIRVSQQNLELSKTVVDIQIQKADLMEQLKLKEYELGKQIAKAQTGLISKNSQSKQAQEVLVRMRGQLDSYGQQKRDLELQVLALKKNYLLAKNEAKSFKAKNQELSLQIINISKELKAVEDAYAKGAVLPTRPLSIPKSDRELQEVRKQLQFLESQNKRLKNQLMRFQLQARNSQFNFGTGNRAQSSGGDRLLQLENEKVQWQSVKNQLQSRVKLANRRSEELSSRIRQLEQDLSHAQESLTDAKNRLDQDRNEFRLKLIQVSKEKSKKDSRDQLIMSLNQRQLQLNQLVDAQRKNANYCKQQVKMSKSYANRLRYLLEDYAPRGTDLPDWVYEQAGKGQPSQDGKEMRKLRQRNKQLENELIRVRTASSGKSSQKGIRPNLEKEIEQLKMSGTIKRPGTSGELEALRKQNMELKEQNAKLTSTLKMGGSNGNLQQKLLYYEKYLKQLEKQRSELIVKCTMAEEQMRVMQEKLDSRTRK